MGRLPPLEPSRGRRPPPPSSCSAPGVTGEEPGCWMHVAVKHNGILQAGRAHIMNNAPTLR